MNKEALRELLARISGQYDPKILDPLVFDLYSRYSAAHRYYHNIVHVYKCLEEFNELKDAVNHLGFQVVGLDHIECAVWYHDVVYSTTGSANEIASALIAAEHLSGLGMPEEFIEIVRRLITATELKHEPVDILERYTKDIDLSIFGQKGKDYREYVARVRLEYGHFEDKEFREERLKIMKEFLEQDKIFHTEFFQEKYEEKARQNIMREIESLEKLLADK